MITIRELKEKWDAISPYSGGYLLISGEHPLSFHIGYHSDGQKSFIVLNTGNIENIKSSKAIITECIPSDSRRISLRFFLNYPSLDEIFVKLCWDLMESSQKSENPVDRILTQYDKWMRLLQQATERSMSSSQQKGLIGELLYFKESLKTMDPAQVLNAWVGSEGSDQDFVFKDSWSEIKTVLIAADNVQISSLQQLDRDDDGVLTVYFMDKTSSAGTQTIALPEIIKEIRKSFASERDLDDFNCKLSRYGYLDKDEEKYSITRYRCAECRSYVVNADFPKLTRDSVPRAITGAHYNINLSVIEDNRLKEV